jgi:hypothetical protein
VQQQRPYARYEKEATTNPRVYQASVRGCSVFYVLSATAVALPPRSVEVHKTHVYARYEKEARYDERTNPGSTKQAWGLFSILCSISDGRGAAAAIRGGAQNMCICALREEARHDERVYQASAGVVRYSVFYQRRPWRSALTRRRSARATLRATREEARHDGGSTKRPRRARVICSVFFVFHQRRP